MQETTSQPSNCKSLLTVIAIAVVLNLGLSVWLVIHTHSSSAATATEKTSPLPKELSTAKREEIFDQIKRLYNIRDNDGLYALFARDAQVQLSKSELVSTMDKLFSTFGKIEDGAFSNYQFAGRQGGKDFYVLKYAVRFSNPSALSAKGFLRVNVAIAGGQPTIYGIFLGSNEQ